MGPSSPGRPRPPAGPAVPGCPASPFSPRSPRGPCQQDQFTHRYLNQAVEEPNSGLLPTHLLSRLSANSRGSRLTRLSLCKRSECEQLSKSLGRHTQRGCAFRLVLHIKPNCLSLDAEREKECCVPHGKTEHSRIFHFKFVRCSMNIPSLQEVQDYPDHQGDLVDPEKAHIHKMESDINIKVIN